MKEKVIRKPKRLLAMNARNWVTFEVSAPNSSPRTKGAKDRKKAFKGTWDDSSESEREQ